MVFWILRKRMLNALWILVQQYNICLKIINFMEQVMNKQKQRGQRRKLKRLIYYLEKDTKDFPMHEREYDHWHMPCDESFINSYKTSGKIKTAAMQCMIDCAQHLYTIKPKDIDFCSIVCMISYPDIWNSQIIIFFNQEYFDNFFIRNSNEQTWSILNNKSMKEIRMLKIIPDFIEVGYLEEICDDGKKIYKNELWLYKELNHNI